MLPAGCLSVPKGVKMKTVLLDDRTWAVMIAVVTLLVGFFVSPVAGFVVLCVLAISYASRIAPQVKKIRERIERQVAEAEESEARFQEVVALHKDLEKRMHAERKEDSIFSQILYEGTCKGYGLGQCPHFLFGRDHRLLMLKGIVKGYYLSVDGRFREFPVPEFRSLIGKEVPEVMVMEAQWNDHEIENAIPNCTCCYVAKPEGTPRHEFYLFWNGLPKWRCLSWDDKGVVLNDLFDQTITLPQQSDMIRHVLWFVTTYNSVTDYAFQAVVSRAVPLILKAAPSEDMKRVRIALMLREQALDGRTMTDEIWQNLVDRDPTKL